jgi:hypothetical protein
MRSEPLTHALRGALRPAAMAMPPLATVLVLGAGGTLGSALLAEALVAGRFQRVMAVVSRPLTSTIRGLHPLPAQTLQGTPRPLGIDTAILVFERARHSNGRDDAFLQPEPADLLPLARALLAGGARRLLVVLPHAPALLPQALRHGLASLDEGAVAALGFEHLVFVRSAQAGAGQAGAGKTVAGLSVASRLQRFADWWMSQLAWMVPASEQPVRAVKLAALVVQLARRLPQSRPGTRVLPQDVLSQAALDGGDTALDDWLART